MTIPYKGVPKQNDKLKFAILENEDAAREGGVWIYRPVLERMRFLTVFMFS